MTLILSGTDNSATVPAVTGTDTDTGIYYPAANQIAIATNGTQAMIVDASQNVGIGTTSPSSKLHVAGGSGSTIRNTASAGSSWFVGSNVDSYVLHNESNTPMVFTTNGTEQARITAAGLWQFNSGYGSVATAYGCRAWVNFNGTGTVAIRASANVSSITDNGTGQYTVNFTTAMPDVNYCFQVNAQDQNNSMGVPTAQADPTRSITTSALPIIYNYPPDQAFYDATAITVAVFR